MPCVFCRHLVWLLYPPLQHFVTLSPAGGRDNQSSDSCFVSHTMLSVLIIVSVSWPSWVKLESNHVRCSKRGFVLDMHVITVAMFVALEHCCRLIEQCSPPRWEWWALPDQMSLTHSSTKNSAHQASPWLSDSLICYLTCQCVGNQLQLLQVAKWAYNSSYS